MNTQPIWPVWHTASFAGTRDINADAVAASTDRTTSRPVVALADGIGDNRAAARAAVRAASEAVTAPVAAGPVAALARAREAVLTDRTAGDCVVVVAQPAGMGYALAWVGDVRAYAWTAGGLHQLTTDHTVAEYFRSRGEPVTVRMEHTVLTSMRTTEPVRFGRVVLAVPAGLLLTSDGVHRVLSPGEMAEILLGGAGNPAAALVAAAREAGATDNATAAVVEPGRRAAEPVAA
jgi:serine/threonine protein phosphatase PrpC